jgi:perosamine synthetase
MKEKEKFIPFHKPSIGNEEISEIVECLKSGWLTTGPRCKQFEADFAKFANAKFAIALNSCTAALHLALEAIGIQENDLVITPTMTFAATAEVVRYFNAIPVFVDSLESDFCIDPSGVEAIAEKLERGEKIKGIPQKRGRLKAILPVHFGGSPAAIPSLLKTAGRYGAALIEDCAHACPTFYKNSAGKMVKAGEEADIACFSFYANKTITTGEGGMAVTNSEKHADRMRIMSLHGISKDAWKRFTAEGSWRYEVIAPGFKYNMPDVAASIGIHQLKKADFFRAERAKIAKKYAELLKNTEGLVLPEEKKDSIHSWHLYVVRIQEKLCGIHRNAVVEKLKERGIGTSVHYMPLHLHQYYKEKYGWSEGDFPVSETLFSQCLSLPIYPGLSDQEIERIAKELKLILRDK